MGTRRDGVNFFDPRENWIRHYNLRDSDGGYLTSAFVQCFIQDKASSDVVWLGSGAGVARWDRSLDQYRYYVHPREEDFTGDPNAVRSFTARRQGGFWIGSAYGLSRYDPKADQLIRIKSPTGLSSEIDDVSRGSIRAVHEDRHGEVWIGMLPHRRKSPGLIRFNPEQNVSKLMEPISSSTTISFSEIQIFESSLSSSGAKYKVLKEFGL